MKTRREYGASLNTRPHFGLIFLFLTILAVLFTAAPHAHAFKKQYKMQVTVGPNFYWGQGAAKFAELVEKKTGGQIIVKPYFGSSLLQGAQLQSAQLVAKGVIDCAFESTINISPVIPECNLFSLPFFINTFENLDRLENGEAGKAVYAAMVKKGLAPLVWGENGFRQITNSVKPITQPADLNGMKVRVVGSPIFIDIFRQLGADPVNMNWGDAITAFQQGVVDAQENPVGVLIPVQISQYHKEVTFWNYLADPLILYWNRRQWESFPQPLRDQILAAATEAARFEKALARAGLDDGRSLAILKDEFKYNMEIPDPVAHLRKNGVNVVQLTDAQRETFRKAVQPVYDKWVPQIGPDLVKAAENDMRESR